VTLFEELVLLKEYEKSEDVLADKVSNKQQEKLDMQNKVGQLSLYRVFLPIRQPPEPYRSDCAFYVYKTGKNCYIGKFWYKNFLADEPKVTGTSKISCYV
jgi:hypothetical protein